MSAVKGGAQRGARVVQSDIAGCETCKFFTPGVLFTLCSAQDAEYRIDNKVELHTVQHMRDSFVGACGDEMRLRKIDQPKGLKWER